MINCPVCEYQVEKRASMSAHLKKHPFIDREKFWEQFQKPVECGCGCGEPVKVYRGKPNKYVLGHNQNGKKLGERPEEVKRKIGAKHKGKVLSAETRKKISDAQVRIWTDNRKNDASERVAGENHPHWKGGRTEELRSQMTNAPMATVLKIRKRDKNTCQMCGKSKKENGRDMDVHHIIPYLDSRNNDDKNLICLCRVCHPIADRGSLNREQIISYFK